MQTVEDLTRKVRPVATGVVGVWAPSEQLVARGRCSKLLFGGWSGSDSPGFHPEKPCY